MLPIRIFIFNYPGSRIQGSKGHRIRIRNTSVRMVRCPRCLTKWKFAWGIFFKIISFFRFTFSMLVLKKMFFFTFTFAREGQPSIGGARTRAVPGPTGLKNRFWTTTKRGSGTLIQRQFHTRLWRCTYRYVGLNWLADWKWLSLSYFLKLFFLSYGLSMGNWF